MRRREIEVADFDAKLDILKRCEVCRLAFNDDDAPYIVPLNFVVAADGGRVTLFFHSALEGRKLDFVRRKCRASFEADCAHGLSSDSAGDDCTMGYESVIGKGYVECVTDETERSDIVSRIVLKNQSEDLMFSRAAVFKLTVDEMTGKRYITERL